jgi:adenylate cyclase
MDKEGDKHRLTAILHADLKGYSRLIAEDDSFTVNTLTAYRKVMTDVIQRYRGRVINAPGDALLSEFVSVLDAVECGVEIQKKLKQKNADLPTNRKLEFRIGINLGDVIDEEGDIHGDGVNISARVEALADGGGICITRSAFDQVKKKLTNLGYEYIGAHNAKNISEPVRVYKVLLEPEFAGKVLGEARPRIGIRSKLVLAAAIILIVALGTSVFWKLYFHRFPFEPESMDKSINITPDKASIAVMPFNNWSNDPEYGYFGDGISEDLITDLSKIPNLLVISRLSAFTYKGKNLNVQKIAKELGVRYVMEGSVRKSGNRIRINAQLIDATNNYHLWAERYDGDINDIFTLQDRITRKIAASLAIKLTEDDENRLLQKGTDNIEAYEAYMIGSTIADSLRYDPEKFAESLTWFKKAIELDPDYNKAYAALAEIYIFGSEFGIQRPLGISSRQARLRGMNYLQTAMNNPTNVAYRIAARVYTYQGQHQKALDYGMKAIALGPNAYRSNAFMALNMIEAGVPDEWIPFADRMRKLDPACLW